MTTVGSNNEKFTNRTSLGGLDMEDGSSSVHVRNLEASLIEVSTETISDDRKEGHVVDIDEWASSLAELLEDVPYYMCRPGHPGTISRIPENIREVDAKSYEPYFMSIGPYHHGSPKVRRMEKRKHIVLKCFLEQNPEITLREYLNEIRSVEAAARSFYSVVEMDCEKFAEMLLLDSLYILIVLCGLPQPQNRLNNKTTRFGRVRNGGTNERADQIDEGMGTWSDNDSTYRVAGEDESDYGTNGETGGEPRWFWAVFSHDLFLLENQLPLFVLQKVYDLVYGRTQSQLMDIMKDTVSTLLLGYTKQDPEMVIPPTEEVHHLLHLCHVFFRPTLQLQSTSPQLLESNQMFRLGSAVQLYEAGVHFEARSDSTQHTLLDIAFRSPGKIVMPCLNVDDNTIALLRNLIALEQMKYPSMGLNVSAYAVLLLHLVTIPADVALLRRKGIIQHHLASDKEMVYLVNRLSVGLCFDYVEDEYSLKHVFQELKRYTEHRVPKWKACLRHRYFHNPWTMISLLAASLLLLLTVIQTYYTVYSYLRPCCDGHLRYP